MSERRACDILGQHRSTQRYKCTRVDADAALAAALREISAKHRAWGYKLAHRYLRRKGWVVNRKRVLRVWQLEGLAAQRPRKKRPKLPGDAKNSIWSFPAERPNHVWAIDFKSERLADGRPYRVLNVLDEYTRRSVDTLVDFSITSKKLQDFLQGLFRAHGRPANLRTDNGPEFVTPDLEKWATAHSITLRPVDVASPEQNGLVETFHRTLEREILGLEHFPSILEARTVINNWRVKIYNSDRPHSSLQDLTPNEFLQACRRASRTGDTLPKPTPERRAKRNRATATPVGGRE